MKGRERRTWRDVTDAELRAVLRTATWDGGDLRLAPGALERPLEQAVRALLRRIGGRWVAGRAVHRYASDQRGTLAAFVAGGPRPSAPGEGDGPTATPAWLVQDLVERYARLREVADPVRVLAFSPGSDALVAAVLACRHAAQVTTVVSHAAQAVSPAGDARVCTVGDRFERFATRAFGAGTRFDAVVMTPSLSARVGAAWPRQVVEAWRLLAPGARLACVAPRSFEYGAGESLRQVRALVDAHGGWRPLGRDAFASAGVSVQAGVLTLARPVR